MSKKTKIQWCDSTINPVMGCDGCELYPSPSQLAKTLVTALTTTGHAISADLEVVIREMVLDGTATDAYQNRKAIALEALQTISPLARPANKAVDKIARAIANEFRCYAGILHLRHGKDANNPGKRTNRGYAPIFEQVTQFPGRMTKAAAMSDLRGTDRPEKPWLDLLPRLIFVSDMGDLLSKSVSFEFIRKELIENVISPTGSRHVWLWLTKRPSRMAKFSEWLGAQGLRWPDNLVAMTSVTSAKTVGRVDQLKKVSCRFRGLSVEPLWGPVQLPLGGIDWVIAGGESGGGAKPFCLEWGRDLREQCREKGTAYFLKQLGSHPMLGREQVELTDGHGGDWSEWPDDLRIREMPAGFKA